MHANEHRLSRIKPRLHGSTRRVLSRDLDLRWNSECAAREKLIENSCRLRLMKLPKDYNILVI